jgi:single-strand DNA-binding protein
MATLNKVMLIGRLTDNPEPPRVLPNSGSTVVKFRFAVGRSRKNPQTGQWENDPNPLYIDCEVFSRADNPRLTDLVSQYCHRGSQIYLEGRLQLDTWNDKDNPSQKRSKHKVIVDQIQLLDSRGGESGGDGMGSGQQRGGAPGRSNQSYSRPAASPMHDDGDLGPPPGDDIPF